MKQGEPKPRREPEILRFPLVSVKDVVVFPNTVIPFVAASRPSVAAADEAARSGGLVFISLLKSDPKAEKVEVHEVGTLCRIVQRVMMPDGSLRLLFSGERKGRIHRLHYDKPWVSCEVELFPEGIVDSREAAALVRALRKSFLQYSELTRKTNPETVVAVESTESEEKLCDIVSNALLVKAERKQTLLDARDVIPRMELLITILESEIEVISLQRKISAKVRSRIEKGQREYFLQEQIREINKELGKDAEDSESKDLERRILSRNPPEEVMDKAKRELSRLSKLQAFSPEAGVLRAYCEWLADLPWSERSEENKDIAKAAAILDEDHYGLKKAKERILEFIAVRQLSGGGKGPILCLSGPPGTGKTSLGRSVARALGRSFVRFSLGGVRDEAEIRGHRKTYVGALPGKVIQSMKKAGTVNPVFLLDEIDKMGADFRGDPASALLEVLDPEQNKSFSDHYLEVTYDLSEVMFITTANSLHGIPFPLLDRMEVIEIPGYSEYEKLEIAKSFIIPRQLGENGLSRARVDFRKQAILDIIRYWTMESGVRNLERQIARVARRLATRAVEAGMASPDSRMEEFSVQVGPKELMDFLGKHMREDDEKLPPLPGCATGLAWTESGGATLPIESALLEGGTDLILTGNLGDVMKESARAALSYIRSHLSEFPEAKRDFSKQSIHVHVPQGAIPKDGPSAGITIVASLLSLLCGIPVREDLAMTGEITLSGRILPVGGIKEKVLAAHRGRFRAVLMPEANRKDLDDIPEEVQRELDFHFASSISEAIRSIFSSGLKPSTAAERRAGRTKGTVSRKTAKAPAPAKKPSARKAVRKKG